MGILAAGDNFGLPWLLQLALPLIYLFIRRYLWPPLKKMMDARVEQIRTSLAAGEEAKEQAAALLEQRRAELAAARGEATTIVETARRSAAQVTADGERRAAEEYERIVVSAHAAIELERSRVRDAVALELGTVVIGAAREVIDAELDPANQHRLIGETIDAAETAGA